VTAGTAVLFLDFDGVLHPKGAGGADQHFCRRPMLEELLLDAACADVRVVITSTWREAYSLHKLRQFFCAALQPRIIDRTPVLEDLDSDHLRYREIRAWLNRQPQVKHWFALDDDRHGFPQAQLERVVLTDPDAGLSAANLASLRALLEKN
jgi:hypothetical protein